jgi:hypothetical protein
MDDRDIDLLSGRGEQLTLFGEIIRGAFAPKKK